MKVQDIAFFIIILFLIFKRDPKWAEAFGLISLALSIPLFPFSDNYSLLEN